MAKRGWVGAQRSDERWVMLSVWDDGWVELPGAGRRVADIRGNLRQAARTLAFVVAGLALTAGLIWLVNLLPSTMSWLMFVPVLGLVAVVAFGSYRDVRLDLRQWRQAERDRDQRLADRRAGLTIKLRPGAPLFRRATSAEQYAAWVENETFVRAGEVASMVGTMEGADQLVAVALRDGRVVSYRSPDPTLTRLLMSFDPTTQGRQPT